MKEIETIKEIRTLIEEVDSLKTKEDDMKNKYVNEILEEEVKRKFCENVPSDLEKLYLLARKKNYKYFSILLPGIGLILLAILICYVIRGFGTDVFLLFVIGIVLIVLGIKKAKCRSENKAFYNEYKKLVDYENIYIKNYKLVINGDIVTNLASYTTYKKDQNFFNPLEKKMLSESNEKKLQFIQERSSLEKKLNKKLEPIKKEEIAIELKIKELADSIFVPESFLNSNAFIDTIEDASKEFKNIHKFSELIQKILDCFQKNRSDYYNSLIDNKNSIIEIVKTTNEFLNNKYIPNFLK